MSHLDDTSTRPSSDLDRRVVLRGAAVSGLALPFLAACGGADEASSSGVPSDGSGGESGIAKADVPVGGGVVLKDEEVVLTQPSEGQFKAFTAVCTHQGCLVTKVEDGQIVCPCHGSHFAIEDGAPVSGPAQAPLAEKKVSVQGDRIALG